MTEDATFFSMGDARYFPGLAAVINSIRVTGHRQPIVVADCGLTPAQRSRLAKECTFVDLIFAANPQSYKPFPYLTNPTGIVVLLDADMIVTGSLEPVIASAAAGKICAFTDPEPDRWFAEWQEFFELRNPPRRQTYVCSGFVAFSTVHFPELLERWWQASIRIPRHRTNAGGAPNSDPIAQVDQDAWNAVLACEFEQEALNALPMEAMPMFSQLARTRVVDEATLACTLDGQQALVLHAAGAGKPWDPRRGWKKVRRDAYVILTRRLLLGEDVPIRLVPEELPIWMRAGAGGELALRALDALNRAAYPARVHVTPRIRQGLRRLQVHSG
jgi:hypothetical protein